MKKYSKFIAVYKLAARLDNELSAGEVVKSHLLHCQENDGVLFTTNKFPSPLYRDQIKKVILTTKDGGYAAIADVEDLGKYGVFAPPAEFSVPSFWKKETTEGKGWYALKNMQKIKISPNQYFNINGKCLLDALSGKGYLTYVEYDE